MCKCPKGKHNPWCAEGVTGVRHTRPTPEKLIVGPVKHCLGVVQDAEGNHIIDIRGWGRLQYMANGADLQEKIGEFVAAAINEKLEKNPI